MQTTRPQVRQHLCRLLDDAANFELGHALRLYCHAHAAAAVQPLLLACSDASMRRVDALVERARQLSGRAPLPHIEVPPVADPSAVSTVLHHERIASLSAADRYSRLASTVLDTTTRELLFSLRAEHLRDSAHFAQLIDRSHERLD